MPRLPDRETLQAAAAAQIVAYGDGDKNVVDLLALYGEYSWSTVPMVGLTLGFFTSLNAAAFAVVRDGTLVISIRGSSPELFDSKLDPTVAFDLISAVTLPDPHYLLLETFVRNAVSQALNAHHVDRVIFTGQSLGGQQATLAAARILQPLMTRNALKAENVSVLLFGSPGVPAAVADGLSPALANRIFSMWNSDDVVHSIPLLTLASNPLQAMLLAFGLPASLAPPNGFIPLVPQLFKLPGSSISVQILDKNGEFNQPVDGIDEHMPSVYYQTWFDIANFAFYDEWNTAFAGGDTAIRVLRTSSYPASGDQNDNFLLSQAGGITLGVSGDDLIARPAAQAGGAFIVGGVGNDTLLGGAGVDYLDGGPGSDQLNGRDGNDHLAGGNGADRIDGGPGDQDIAVFSSPSDEYVLTHNVDGSWTVSHEGGFGLDGVDILTNVEYVQFADLRTRLELGRAITGGGVDLCLVIDTTGSMEDDIASVKQAAAALVAGVFRDGAPSRVSILGFKDPGETSVILPFTSQASLAARQAAALAAINGIDVEGGGDTPEGVYSALKAALEGVVGAWRSDASVRRIVLFGDAPAKDGHLRAQVEALARNVLGAGALAVESQTEGALTTVTVFAALADGLVVNRSVEIYAVVVGADPDAIADFGTIADHNQGVLFEAEDAEAAAEALSQAITASYRLALTGTDGPDTLFGTVADDRIAGLGGADRLTGGEGSDVLVGGEGADQLMGLDGDDDLDGGPGLDELYGADGADRLQGSGEGDLLSGGAGDDVLRAGAANPNLIVVASAANASFASAISLDGAFSLFPSANIVDSASVPHATVEATASGHADYYKFTVTRAASNVVVDLDGFHEDFDGVLELYNAAGVLLASNDDASIDPGSFGDLDPRISFTISQPGVYYVRLRDFDGGGVVSGVDYALHVSLQGAPLSTVFGDEFDGGEGDDLVFGGGAIERAYFQGMSADFAWWKEGGAWFVQDLRPGSPDGLDILRDVEVLQFFEREVKLTGLTQAETLSLAFENVLRRPAANATDAAFLSGLNAQVASGGLALSQAIGQIVQQADQSTSVASLAYQFFLGVMPSKGGFDYLVSPTGPNVNNLNSAYYQSFNIENRYINFAVNLGKVGEGAADFSVAYGALSLFDATKQAYATIFGAPPGDAKVGVLLDAMVGPGMSRTQYFASYGGDGVTGIGTKAAMVGWLLAEAVKADLGQFARANSDYLADLADGAPFLVDLVGDYGRPQYVYGG